MASDILIGNICSLCAMVTDSISSTRKKNSEVLGIQMLSQVFYGAGSILLNPFGSKKRTTIYYAHPYSANERGANEGANVLIRMFVPMRSDLVSLSPADLKRITHWINHYPRRKLLYASAFEQSAFASILADVCVI